MNAEDKNILRFFDLIIDFSYALCYTCLGKVR